MAHLANFPYNGMYLLEVTYVESRTTEFIACFPGPFGKFESTTKQSYVMRGAATQVIPAALSHSVSGRRRRLQDQPYPSVLFLKCALQKGEGRKGRECKFKNKTH